MPPERRARGTVVAAAAMLLAAACGGGGDGVVDAGSGSCASLGTGRWVGTESVAITAGSCSPYSGLAVTFTVTQAPGSCAFTMTNSRVAGITFSGTVRGSAVSWTAAPYAYLGGTLTLGAVAGALSDGGQTLAGTFRWTLSGSASPCAGTTTFSVARQ